VAAANAAGAVRGSFFAFFTKAGTVGDPIAGRFVVLAVPYPEPILAEAGSAAQEMAGAAPGASVV
jgi:hypothetical protein